MLRWRKYDRFPSRMTARTVSVPPTGAGWRRTSTRPCAPASPCSPGPVKKRGGEGLARLADDLCTGRWQDDHADLLGLDSLDVGYCLVIAEP